MKLSTNTALVAGEACRFDIRAARITDLQGAHPAADSRIAFTVASTGGNPDPATRACRPATTQGQHQQPQPAALLAACHHQGHTAYPYSGSGTSTWTILEIADEDPNNSGRILDAYRNHSYAKVTDRAAVAVA